MASRNSTNTRDLASFSVLNGPDRLAVMLKAEGKSAEQIATGRYSEFGTTRSKRTVQEWFIPGGRLEQAYLEWSEVLASESVRDAQILARRAARGAVGKLISLSERADDAIALRAATALAAKYLAPGKSGGGFEEEELPPQLEDDVLISIDFELGKMRGE